VSDNICPKSGEHLDAIARPLNYFVFGCWAQTWAANSLSRRASWLRVISWMVLPIGGPAERNTQLQLEQAKP
jgi:hypothetical protein